jgi:hypothetical protein
VWFDLLIFPTFNFQLGTYRRRPPLPSSGDTSLPKDFDIIRSPFAGSSAVLEELINVKIFLLLIVNVQTSNFVVLCML